MALVVNMIQDLGYEIFTSLVAAADWCSLWTLATISHSKRASAHPGRSYDPGYVQEWVYLDAIPSEEVSAWVLVAYWDLEKSPVIQNSGWRQTIIGFNLLFNLIIIQQGQPPHSQSPSRCQSLPQLHCGFSFPRHLLFGSRLFHLDLIIILLGISNRLVDQFCLCHILLSFPHAVASNGCHNRLQVGSVKDCKDSGVGSLKSLLLHKQ